MKLKALDYYWSIEYTHDGAVGFIILQNDVLMFEGFRNEDGDWSVLYNTLPTDYSCYNLDGDNFCPILGPLDMLGHIFEWPAIPSDQTIILHTHYDEDIHTHVPACTVHGVTLGYLHCKDDFKFYLTDPLYATFTIKHMGYLELLHQCTAFFNFIDEHIDDFTTPISTTLAQLTDINKQTLLTCMTSCDDLTLLFSESATTYTIESPLFLH